MKNIGILEIHFHVKYLYTTMRICKTKNTKLTVFTTKEIHSRILTYLGKKSDYEFVLKKDNESKKQFIKRVEQICNERIDLLLVNTIQMSCINVPHYIKFNPKCKKILTIHLINHWLIRKFTVSLNFLRSTDVTICIFLIRKFILPKYDGINVVYAPLKDYVEKNTNYKGKVFTLPFNFFDEKKKITTTKKDKKIRFVMPGIIETYRRDYNLTLELFEKLFEKYNDKISLWILGKPKGSGGRAVIEKCKKLKEKGYNISFSKEFIPEEKYDKILIESDIIFSPLNTVTKRDTGIKEIYGKTEGSALPFEAIQYAKPLVVPAEFNIDKLKTSSLQYKNKNDLEKILIDLITGKIKLDDLKENALKNSKKYSLSVLQEYFISNLLNN